MPNESIGGISVSISVGLQDLQAQFEQAQQMADAAGKAMASAFNSSTGSLTQLGAAASGATQKVDSLSSSLSTAASGLTNAGLVFSTLSAGIIGLGVEALETAGKFEQWEVSFTRLLGSAQAAKDMLGQLVDFAISTPFEIKDLVPNAQKLMAMGFAAQDVIPMLRTLGDAVSGLGKGADSLNSLTLAFGEMEGKGVVQLRQLNMLAIQGIPAIELLAEAYGKSTLQITDMISKKLIPASEGIPILLAGINQKFSGMMEAQSQTLLGMWSNLADATVKTANAIGQAMLPMFKSLETAAFSVLSGVQKLAEMFRELPAPVQETAVAIAAIVAAIGPLLLGLAAVSFALKSLVELPAAFTALRTALGLMATGTVEAAVAATAAGTAAAVATPEVAALAVAEASAGEVATVSAIQLGLFGEAIAAETVFTSTAITQLSLFSEEMGAIAVTSAESAAAVESATFGFAALDTAVSGAALAFGALMGYKVGEWLRDNVPAAKAFGDAIGDAVSQDVFLGAALQTLADKFYHVKDATDQETNSAFLLSQKLGELGVVVPRGTMSLEQWSAALATAAANHEGFNKAVAEGNAGLLKLQQTYDTLQDNFDQAKAVLAAAAEGMRNGTVSAGEYQLALKNVDDAQKKLNAGSKDYQDTLGGLTESYNKQEATVGTLQNTIAQLLSIQNRTQAQDDILTEAENKLASAVKARAAAHGIATAAMQDQGKAYEGLVKSADQLMTKEIASSVAVSQAKVVLDQLTASTDTSAAHTRAVTDALNQYSTALKNTGVPLNGLITLTKDGVQYTTTLAEALGHAKDGMTAFSDEAVAVPQSVDKAWQSADQFGRALRETVDGTNGVIDVLRALPPVAAEAKRQFDQLGYGAGNSAALIKTLTDQMSRNIAISAQAVNANSALANSITHVGEATADALAVAKAWDSSTSSAVDNTSRFANSISHATGELHNMVTAADAAGTAAFDADKSFKATTGSVNALSVGVAFLAMQLSGLTAFAGSGINYAAGQSDLQHQLYLARQAAGDPTAQPANFTVATSGALKGQSFNSLDDLNQALADLAKNTDAAATSTEKLSNATAKSTQSTLQYVDGVGNIYDSYQEMIDAIAANPNLGGLTSTIDRLSSTATTANTATQQATQAQQQFVDGLGNVYDSYQALTAAIAANPLLGGPATSTTGDKISGPSSMPSTMAEALANMSKLATPNGATGDSKIPNVLGTFNGQVITGSPGMSLSDAIALMHIGVGSGSGAVTALPGSMVTSNGTSNYTPVPSNQQSGSGITVQMNYPSFNSQQQADQVVKQVVTQLRTVVGLKL